MTLLIVAAVTDVLGSSLCDLAVFLILLVLVQRGRGGGLAGALGGMGGSSAFGAKAGDIFTRITIVTAAIWIVLCIAAASSGRTIMTAASRPRRRNDCRHAMPRSRRGRRRRRKAGEPRLHETPRLRSCRDRATPSGAAPTPAAPAPPAEPAGADRRVRPPLRRRRLRLPTATAHAGRRYLIYASFAPRAAHRDAAAAQHDRFWRSSRQTGDMSIAVEVRTINSRHFKLTCAPSDGYARSSRHRGGGPRRHPPRHGAVNFASPIDRAPTTTASTPRCWTSYRRPAASSWRPSGTLDDTAPASRWLTAARRHRAAFAADTIRTTTGRVRADVRAALDGLARDAGRGRRARWPPTCACNGRRVETTWTNRRSRAGSGRQPTKSDCTTRRRSRSPKFDVTVEPADLVREVCLFADRSDICEEIVRLRSHLQQYEAVMLPPKAPAASSSSSPGNGPRNQHDRLQGQRRRNLAAGRRNQDRARTNSRADSERRVRRAASCGSILQTAALLESPLIHLRAATLKLDVFDATIAHDCPPSSAS